MSILAINQYIRNIELRRDKIVSYEQYPFSLPIIKDLSNLYFHPKVTYLVGENGSGKSTILESIAVACGFNAEGGSINFDFETKATHSELYNYIKIVRGVKRPRDGFFLRSESFYNLASNIDALGVSKYYGGQSLHNQSHGESFFSVFLNRFGGHGLYILDEPEAALSPSRQMSMLTRMHDLLKEDSQFIIATHSPILMAYPDSVIYEIKEGIREVKYEDTEHYQITRSFLNNTKGMLNILLREDQ